MLFLGRWRVSGQPRLRRGQAMLGEAAPMHLTRPVALVLLTAAEREHEACSALLDLADRDASLRDAIPRRFDGGSILGLCDSTWSGPLVLAFVTAGRQDERRDGEDKSDRGGTDESAGAAHSKRLSSAGSHCHRQMVLNTP